MDDNEHTPFAAKAQILIDQMKADNEHFAKVLGELSSDIDQKFAAADAALNEWVEEIEKGDDALGVV